MSTMHWYIVLVLIAFTIPHCKGAGACERYSPCQNNGTCYDYSQESYICNCTGGFTGQNCSTEVDPCDRKMSCGNGGVCLSISGKSSHDKGYSGKYCNKTLACGSTFTEADGERNIIMTAQARTIIPPFHNRFDRVVCQYKINATIGHRIQINFIETNHTYWRRPARLPVYYEIHEGISARGTPVRRWQGTGLTYPTSYLSNGNVINIVIKAASLFYDSWSLSLEYVIVTGCNMVFQRQEGVFSYSDDKLGQSASCTYQIRGNSGERIILGFQQMRLSDDPTCSHDKLSIYEGTNSSGPLAQVQCGSNTTDFLSKSHNLFLVFNAKPANFTRRFEIYYGIGERGCGRTYTSTSGIIIPQQLRPFSPPKNVHCVYQIIGEKGSTILLKAYNNVVDSLRDFFLVYEDKSTEPFAFPTRKYDNFYLSRSNNITIISGKLGRIVPTFLCHYMINNGCNARINTNSPSIRSGYFSSPPYSLQYPNAITCNYTIMVKSGFRVVLVLEADIDNSTFCSARNISVFEGINASGEQLYSGCKYQKIIARSNELFLQFRSSGIKKGKGFGALVQGRFKSCWSTPKQLNRYPAPLDIKSWNYPWKIPNNWGCFYELTPSYQNPIFVRFLKFSLEESKGCEKDNLKVYNTSISKKTLLYTRCGNQNSTLRIITRKLVLVFKSDWTIRSSAYRINVEECGGQLWDYSYWYTQRVKFLKTPAYPNHYPNDVHCIYEITAEYGNINLNFTSFELEASDGCKKDWLKIYEGSISNETLVQTRCGNDTRPYITNMLKVFMVFHTDMAVAKKGFVAEYKRCSYSFTESNGTFSTPFTFNDYYSNRYCTFLIRPQGAKKINLRLPYVLVDGKSYINIYNGSNKFAPLFTSLTKRGEIVQGHNTSISIDASAIFVEFYKSSSQHGRFTAFFFTSTGACERYSPCQNNGTCYDYSQESYTCNCTCGFTSQNCTTKVDPCDAKPCQNGVCLSISGKASQSFVCRCNSGFTGQNCTTKVDPCDAKPCQNGVCLKASQSFVCRCNSGFTGQNCTTKVDPCDVKPCQNGVCLNISGKASQSFVCHCDNGYSGKYCNYTRDFAVRSNKHVAIIATTVPVAILLVVFVTIVLIKCRRSRELLQRDAPKAALVNSYSLEDVPGAKDLSVL